MLKGGLLLIWELDMNLVPTLTFIPLLPVKFMNHKVLNYSLRYPIENEEALNRK